MLHKWWEEISWYVLILLPATRARHCSDFKPPLFVKLESYFLSLLGEVFHN